MRGRLSAIELLPTEADPALHWFYDQLVANRNTQAFIVKELNRRLKSLGVEKTVSSSALNRFVNSGKIETLRRRLGIAPAASSQHFTPAALAELTQLIDDRMKRRKKPIPNVQESRRSGDN